MDLHFKSDITCQAEFPAGYKWDQNKQDCVAISITGCSAPKDRETYMECVSKHISEIGPGSQLVTQSVIGLGAIIVISVMALFVFKRKARQIKNSL